VRGGWAPREGQGRSSAATYAETEMQTGSMLADDGGEFGCESSNSREKRVAELKLKENRIHALQPIRIRHSTFLSLPNDTAISTILHIHHELFPVCDSLRDLWQCEQTTGAFVSPILAGPGRPPFLVFPIS
jgi:hypothetical protein